MNTLRKPVYLAAGFYTVSFGTGRKEFNPKKPRPGLEEYIKEAGLGVIAQIKDPMVIDEGVISNFMAARFNRQGNLAAFLPMIHPALHGKPHTRVEGACGSGGLCVATAMKAVLAETADVALALGTEVQNTVKAIYGADFLAGAGHYRGERKLGHTYFFPNKFAERAGALFEKYGQAIVREAMAHWYEQAVLSARRCPKAQEYHNAAPNLFELGMTPPNAEAFVPNINYFDCSKVSDGAAAVLVASREGLEKAGIPLTDACEIVGWGTAVADITAAPHDLTKFTTSALAVSKAYKMAGITAKDLSVVEVHDCFTISGLLSLEAAGICKEGESFAYVTAGKSRFDGELPVNPTGGLIGYGHYTGGTGVRQAIDILQQLTGKAEAAQTPIHPDRPYGLMISMGGNDRTVTAFVFKKIG